MYKNFDVNPKVEEKVGLTEQQLGLIKTFALTTKAVSVHDFVVDFNQAKKGFTVCGNDVEGLLSQFEQEALQAKQLVQEDKPLPQELSAFSGKFTKVVAPVIDIKE